MLIMGLTSIRVMLRVVASLVVLGSIAVSVGGCGYSDANATFVPDALRYRAPQAKTEIIPDMKAVLRERGGEVFSSRTPPQNIRVSIPRRSPTGSGWTSCVRADVAGVTGKPIGTQTYLLTIDANNKIGDRRLTDASSPCASETYEPV